MDTPGRRIGKSDVILHRIVIITSLVSFIINCVVLAISCASGQWVFGYALCQIYGLMSQVLVAGSAWMVALVALERCYRVLMPTEHNSTFSEINVRILVYGVYLLLLVMYTAPLYGWGEYSNLRGAVHMSMNVIPGNESCINNISHFQVYHSASEATGLILQSVYECDVRLLVQEQLLVIRFPTRPLAHMFYSDFSDGHFQNNVSGALMTSFEGCNTTSSDIHISFTLEAKSFNMYKDVHLTFQEIGVCALDFSPVNKNIASWIPFSVLCTSGLPFGISAVLGLILWRTPRAIKDRYPYSPQALTIGSILGLATTVPYYVINIYNNKEIYVNHSAHVVATVMYYSCAMCYVITAMILNCFSRYSRSIRHGNRDSEVSLERLSSCNKIVVQQTRVER